MNRPRPAVRILVLEPGDPARRDQRTARALSRLGDGVRVEVFGDAEAARSRLAGADLVVIDEAAGALGLGLVEGVRRSGPPVVFATRSPGEEVALEAFRRGAADCVAVTDDYEEALPVAALEQIRRYRLDRERGEAERRIQRLEDLYRGIVEAIPAALAVLDADGTLVIGNPALARLAGVSGEALRGRALADLLPDALWVDGLTDAVAEARRGGDPSVRLGRLGAGPGRAFEMRVQRLDGGRQLLVLLSEVTEIESLLRRVGDLQRYNENIIQNMNSALLVVDGQGLITFANPTAEAVLGAGAGETLGRSLWDWFPDQPSEEVLVSRTLRDGVRFRGAETVVRRPDGRLVPIGVSCAPLVDAAGRREGAVAIFQDLSEIKQLQRQVLQTEKMASIGQLAAGVAHEINNPMGFIHANLYQMAEYLEDLGRVWEKVSELRKVVEEPGQAGERSRAAARDLSAVIEDQEADYLLDDIGKAARESIEGSERIRAIVQDLRAFSHQDTAERSLADVNKALDSTANIVWTMMKHSVVLTKQYAELPPVPCYPMQLKQVFMNLLVNAYQAIEERVATGEELRGEIRLRSSLRDGGVVVEVADNGAGIPPEEVDRIFDPFFTTKEVGIGTGLGLSTSYTLVKRHGGDLSVRSRPGEGTTFELWLPLEAETQV